MLNWSSPSDVTESVVYLWKTIGMWAVIGAAAVFLIWKALDTYGKRRGS